jgi:hypothetical protein
MPSNSLADPARRPPASATMLEVLTAPSGWIPIAMSIAAVALVVGYVLIVGDTRQEDEGIAARLWQALMAGQIPIIAFFALTRLPRTPRPAAMVLGLQLAAGLAAAGPVFVLGF